MFSIFFRRLQKFIPFLRLGLLAVSLAGLVVLILLTEPHLASITLATLLIAALCLSLSSFVFSGSLSFLIALAVGFSFFLKAVDLLSLINILMLIVFLILLALYLKPEVRSHSEPTLRKLSARTRLRNFLMQRIWSKIPL